MDIAEIFQHPQITSTVGSNLPLYLFGPVVVASIVWCIYLSVKEKDLLPIFVCIGALICSLNEPIYDILGKIVYAENNPMAYSNMGRDVPWFLVIGYVPWVGALSVQIARMMAKGVDPKVLNYIALGSCISVVCIETLGNMSNAWIYYGEAPLKYLVVAPQMAPVPIVGGLLLYAFAFPLKGIKRALVAMAISTLALPMVFASASWPLYYGLYADLPKFMDWILGAVMLTFTVMTVVGATSLASRLYNSK
ncbi:hypothetical protein [Zhongshania marina]|uniref:Uncharacterized protein n=1 Tax=Zhongshania marina TaxID=2304603 RepID=A0ABX9W4A9_9GAMM|nr:hypothetical protein D0911_06720 [Zhongshania marina]